MEQQFFTPSPSPSPFMGLEPELAAWFPDDYGQGRVPYLRWGEQEIFAGESGKDVKIVSATLKIPGHPEQELSYVGSGSYNLVVRPLEGETAYRIPFDLVNYYHNSPLRTVSFAQQMSRGYKAAARRLGLDLSTRVDFTFKSEFYASFERVPDATLNLEVTVDDKKKQRICMAVEACKMDFLTIPLESQVTAFEVFKSLHELAKVTGIVVYDGFAYKNIVNITITCGKHKFCSTLVLDFGEAQRLSVDPENGEPRFSPHGSIKVRETYDKFYELLYFEKSEPRDSDKKFAGYGMLCLLFDEVFGQYKSAAEIMESKYKGGGQSGTELTPLVDSSLVLPHVATMKSIRQLDPRCEFIGIVCEVVWRVRSLRPAKVDSSSATVAVKQPVAIVGELPGRLFPVSVSPIKVAVGGGGCFTTPISHK